jgi:hypothetical protein
MTFGKHKNRFSNRQNTGFFNSDLLSYEKQSFTAFSSALK